MSADHRRDPVARLNQAGKGPPCSKHLGMRALEADVSAGTVVLAFEARSEFANPLGQVQGGFVAAMLDEAASIAAIVESDFTAIAPTLEMKTSFLAPVPVGQLTAKGRVVRRGKSIAYLEADLFAPDGTHCAHATSTARVVPRPARLHSLSKASRSSGG